MTLRSRFSRRTSVWPGNVLDRRQRAQRAGVAGRADQQRALDRIHGGARRLRESDADGVGAIVDDHRGRRRLALHDGAGVELELLRREPGARRHRLIDLEHRRRTADRVLDAVEHVDDARDLLDRLADLRRPRLQQHGILREQLDHERFRRARQVADHVLEQLDELDVQHRQLLVHLLRTSAITSSPARSRLRFSLTAMSPVLASVTAARPSCRPVRRDVLSTSGVERRICSTVVITRLVSWSDDPAGMM